MPGWFSRKSKSSTPDESPTPVEESEFSKSRTTSTPLTSVSSLDTAQVNSGDDLSSATSIYSLSDPTVKQSGSWSNTVYAGGAQPDESCRIYVGDEFGGIITHASTDEVYTPRFGKHPPSKIPVETLPSLLYTSTTSSSTISAQDKFSRSIATSEHGEILVGAYDRLPQYDSATTTDAVAGSGSSRTLSALENLSSTTVTSGQSVYPQSSDNSTIGGGSSESRPSRKRRQPGDPYFLPKDSWEIHNAKRLRRFKKLRRGELLNDSDLEGPDGANVNENQSEIGKDEDDEDVKIISEDANENNSAEESSEEEDERKLQMPAHLGMMILSTDSMTPLRTPL